MPDTLPKNSVGIIKPQIFAFEESLTLRSGKTLPRYDLMVETYGQLNEQKSNAVLICHALSGDHHAAGYHSMDDRKPGWWDEYIGPAKPIDTNQFYVVSLNNIGGCSGSTGPLSVNPQTGKNYGPDFPIVTVEDWVATQHQLMKRLGIEQWAVVIGGSLGGMQALRWAIDHPHCIRNAIAIASAPNLSAQNIAFNEIARQSIKSDPDFHDGHYQNHSTLPKRGLMLARMVGHVTYLSDHSMRRKFIKTTSDGEVDVKDKLGRDLHSKVLSFEHNMDFQVESYLKYNGKTFSQRFDANTYLLMTKALDYFDPAVDFDNDLAKAFSQATCKFMIISFTTDWRFSPERSKELVNALVEAKKDVSYMEIEADHGHDAFLIPIPRYQQVVSHFMKRIDKENTITTQTDSNASELSSQEAKHVTS